MKINYVMTEIHKTGGSYVILEIIKGLIERGHNVSITTNWGQAVQGIKLFMPDNIVDRFEARIFYSKRIWMKAISHFIKQLAPRYSKFTRLVRFLGESIPESDIIVATDCFSAYPVSQSRSGIHFYHIQHYEEIFYSDQNLKDLVKATYALHLNKISNSIWLKNQIKHKHGIDTPIINPAINHDQFYPRKVEKNGKKKIICYGRRDTWKGFKDAIEAMKIVFQNRKDVEWIVFGFPRLPKDDKAPYTHLGYLNHDALAKLYSSADVFFLPSWFESFPLQPLEAMACGAPVVTTCYGVEDYAFENVNALVVPPKKPRLMALAILKLLDDKTLSDRFVENGLVTAKKFTWERSVDKVEQLFIGK